MTTLQDLFEAFDRTEARLDEYVLCIPDDEVDLPATLTLWLRKLGQEARFQLVRLYCESDKVAFARDGLEYLRAKVCVKLGMTQQEADKLPLSEFVQCCQCSGTVHEPEASPKKSRRRRPGRKPRPWVEVREDHDLYMDWWRMQREQCGRRMTLQQYAENLSISRGDPLTEVEIRTRIDRFRKFMSRLLDAHNNKPSNVPDDVFANSKSPGLSGKEMRGLVKFAAEQRRLSRKPCA